MTERSCLACDHRYTGGVRCPACAEPAGEPVDDAYRRGPGRPRLEDKRKPRGGFSDAEWARVKAQAKAEGLTAAAWVRARCGA